MKYRADFKRKMAFNVVMAEFNSDSKYIACSPDAPINIYQLFETKILSFNIFGELFIDGKLDDTIKYQELVKNDWYQVYQIPEFQKPTIDTNRKINDKGTITDIKKEMVIDGLNVTEHIKEICKEEIAKSERQIKLLGNIREAFNFAEKVVSTAKKISKERSEQLLKSINKKQKNPKQEFDGENRIWINKENDALYCYERGYFCLDGKCRLATQSDINKFFKGTKKRNRIEIKQLVSEEYYELNGKTYHCKLGFKDSNMYYKREIATGYIESITEEEYLKGIQNDSN